MGTGSVCGMDEVEMMNVIWEREYERVRHRMEHESGKKHIDLVAVGDGAVNLLLNCTGVRSSMVKTVVVTTNERDGIYVDRLVQVGRDVIPEWERGPGYVEVAEYAFESKKVHATLQEALAGSRVVLLVACLGGCTGSVGGRTVVDIARRMGKYVVAVTVMPFFAEGRERYERAERFRGEIAARCDLHIPLENDWLMKHPDMPLHRAMSKYSATVDYVLRTFISVMEVDHLKICEEEFRRVVSAEEPGKTAGDIPVLETHIVPPEDLVMAKEGSEDGEGGSDGEDVDIDIIQE